MLPTGDPLGTVVTMLATPFGRLDGLAIDTAGAGGWRPTGSPPDSTSEGVIDGLPGSVSFPRRKVVVDGPPWGKIVGQRSPDTAIAVAVEDGINHGPHLGLAWPPTGAGRRQEGLQDSPLLACQITGVWLRVHTLSTFETPLLEQTLSKGYNSLTMTTANHGDQLPVPIPNSFRIPHSHSFRITDSPHGWGGIPSRKGLFFRGFCCYSVPNSPPISHKL